jgi:hypothetical protein
MGRPLADLCRRWLDRRRHGDNRDEWPAETWDELPDLPEWDAAHTDPDSGVWCIHPPCGYPTWKLYRPGTQLNPDGFVEGDPAAEFDAINGPGRERASDPCRRLADIEPWAVPWIEQVSGGRVAEIVEGWSSYGPDLQLREWAVYARVEGRP